MTTGRLVFETALGFFGIAWTGEGLSRVVLPERDHSTAAMRLAKAAPGAPEDPSPPPTIAALVGQIRRYAEGEAVDFGDAPVDLAGIDAFRRAVYAAARGLAHGEIVTYGELAARAGYPGMARETGAALGRNPVPLVVPCHRIAAAGGRIGGFSAPGGTVTKQRLLAHERARMSPCDPAQGSFGF